MTVKEIIEHSAKLLNISVTEAEIDIWVNCYNFVEQDLATNYFPVLEVDKFFNVEDKIYYKDFSRSAYMIKGIQDFRGDKVNFMLKPDYIELNKNYEGHTFFVKYYYLPVKKVLNDLSTYGADYLDILKYGVATEYCLAIGEYLLASNLHDTFKALIKKRPLTRKFLFR